MSCMNGYSCVRRHRHGKGTGALRNAVQAHLKRLKYVKSFHLGEYGEGDAGVTIAEFKD